MALEMGAWGLERTDMLGCVDAFHTHVSSSTLVRRRRSGMSGRDTNAMAVYSAPRLDHSTGGLESAACSEGHGAWSSYS